MSYQQTLNMILKTVGLPPLGQRWTGQELAIGIALAAVILPLALLAAMAMWLWRRATRPLPSQPISRVRRQQGWQGPYTDYDRAHSLFDWSVTACRHCGATIKPFVDVCPFCGRDQKFNL